MDKGLGKVFEDAGQENLIAEKKDKQKIFAYQETQAKKLKAEKIKKKKAKTQSGLKNRVRGGILFYLKNMSDSTESERKKGLLKLGKKMAEFAGGEKATGDSVKKALDGLGFSPEMKIQATEVIQQAFEENMIHGNSEEQKNYNFYDLAVATEEANAHFWKPILENAETPPEKIYLKVKRRKIKEYGSVVAADKAEAEQRLAVKAQRRQAVQENRLAKQRAIEAEQRAIEAEQQAIAVEQAQIAEEIRLGDEEQVRIEAAVKESKELAKNLEQKIQNSKEETQKTSKKKKRFAKLGKFLKRAAVAVGIALVVAAGVFGLKNNQKTINKKAKEHKEIITDSVKNNIVVEDINDIVIEKNEVLFEHENTQKPTGDETTVSDQGASDNNTNSSLNDPYVVKEGDCLWDISKDKYGDATKCFELARKNGVENPDLIYPGDELSL